MHSILSAHGAPAVFIDPYSLVVLTTEDRGDEGHGRTNVVYFHWRSNDRSKRAITIMAESPTFQ
jgi:hypothetical protein